MNKLARIMAGLPDRFRPEMAGNLRSTIQLNLTGPEGGQWTMAIAEGRCTVISGPAERPAAVITMDAAEFAGINTGQVSAVEVFWSGRIAVEGEMDAVIALQAIMDWR
jgi:putative sterol carrier protein